MGGLALKTAYTRRYERDEFLELQKEIFPILEKTFTKFDLPRYYYDKLSFGDMDIIISMENFEYEGGLRKYIEDTFKPEEIFHNDHSWSFDYKELQIDFITCSAEDYDSNYHYLSFNDLGNFIGRMAQTIGLKYGQEGLWYNHYHSGNQKNKIMVSKDYPKIFEYLHLDYGLWEDGFSSLEEIFEYVKTSRLYNPEIFQMHHLNKINRDRNAKRASYVSFLEYIEGDVPNEDYDPEFVAKHKENITKEINESFPEANVVLALKELEYIEAKNSYATVKFNGHIVGDKYGLSGKELGDSIKTFREIIESKYNSTYIDFIVNNDEEKVYSVFEQSNQL